MLPTANFDESSQLLLSKRPPAFNFGLDTDANNKKFVAKRSDLSDFNQLGRLQSGYNIPWPYWIYCFIVLHQY